MGKPYTTIFFVIPASEGVAKVSTPSFPRRREPIEPLPYMDPRLRGDDDGCIFLAVATTSFAGMTGFKLLRS